MMVSTAKNDGIEYSRLNYVTWTEWIVYIYFCRDCGWLMT